jgi:hypothetical protein
MGFVISCRIFSQQTPYFCQLISYLNTSMKHCRDYTIFLSCFVPTLYLPGTPPAAVALSDSVLHWARLPPAVQPFSGCPIGQSAGHGPRPGPSPTVKLSEAQLAE